MPDPACLLHGLAHGKDQAGNRHLRPLLKMKPLDGMMADAVTPAGFAEVRMALPSVDQDHGDLGLVPVALADHFGGGAKLAGGAVDGGGGTEAAELEFEDGGGMAVGEGDGVQLPEAVAAAEVVTQLRILISEDTPVPEFEMAGEKGADTELGRSTDDGEGGGLNADLARPLPFPSTADGEAFGPTQVFPVVRMDELGFPVVGEDRGRVRIQVEPWGFLAPTTQQIPALQRTRARVPVQNHSPWATNF